VKRVVYATALLVVVFDQLSKAWAFQHLADQRVHALLPGLLQQRLVFNRGAAFSLLSGNSLGLGVVTRSSLWQWQAGC